jgi:4-amino-4-deoxy-L-arabinose transferase-like glycosyltransferase
MSIPALAVYLSPDDRSVFFNKDDTLSYIRPAMGLTSLGKFVSDGRPEFNRTPGYPLLLVPGILLGNVELVTVGIQVVLSSLTILLVYGISMVLFYDQRIAAFSAGFYALEPLSLIQTSILQTETFFAFTFTAFLFFLLRYLKKSSLNDLLAAGLIASVAAYIRPVAYFMPMVVGFLLLVRMLIKFNFRVKPLVHVILFLLVAMTPLLIWQVRNKIETGHFLFSSQTGTCIYFCAGGEILHRESGSSVADRMQKMGYNENEVYFELHPEQRQWSETERDYYRQKEGLRIVLTHPFQFLRMLVVKAVWTSLGPGLSDWFCVFNIKFQRMDKVLADKRDSLRLLKGPRFGLLATFLLAGILAGYWILAVLCLFGRKPGTHEGVLFLVILAAYYVFLPAAVGLGYSRYRHPIMPILCVFAGNGLAMVWDKCASRRQK